MSVPKTIEEILRVPPMSYNDLLGPDLLDYFTTKPNVTAFDPPVAAQASAAARAASDPPETARIWVLADRLDNSTYDVDTVRLGELTTVYMQSVRLAHHRGRMSAADYRAKQGRLYARARQIVSS